MRQLGIDNDLIGWTQSFLTNRKVKIVINRHINHEKDVEISVPQESSVLPILFLIYIIGVFDIVITISPETVSFLFMNDIRFLVTRNLIQEV